MDPTQQQRLDILKDVFIRLCQQIDVKYSEGDVDYCLYLCNILRKRLTIISQYFPIPASLLSQIETLSTNLLVENSRFTEYEGISIRTTDKGNPYDITEVQLEFFVKNGFKYREIAAITGMAISTVKRRCKEYGISKKGCYYTRISDQELRKVIKNFTKEHPNKGYIRCLGYLRSKNINVTFKRVKTILHEVDPLGSAERYIFTLPIIRRQYRVSGPNALWHIDGNHKLARWKFVIHGGIDGHSRFIVYMQASANNRADTVFKLFLQAVQGYGIPSRVRSDFGIENRQVCKFMLEHPNRGPGRSSFITGPSVRNQRIERLWKDLWENVNHLYYKKFYELERKGVLNPDNVIDIVALHTTYMQDLNNRIESFKTLFNNSPNRMMNFQSPVQNFTIDKFKYSNLSIIEEMEANTIDEFYGVEENIEPGTPFLDIPEEEMEEQFEEVSIPQIFEATVMRRQFDNRSSLRLYDVNMGFGEEEYLSIRRSLMNTIE